MATPSSTDRQPEAGDVIEFSFLWSHELAQGRVEGAKDRPCVIVRVLDGPRIVVAPITGTEPDRDHKIALSAGAFSLARTSWIVTSEINVSEWPGYDLRSATQPAGAFWRYGRLSDRLRAHLAEMVEHLIRSRQVKITPRAS